jgi:hypothetical protein
MSEREVVKTESPNGEVITDDREGGGRIRLWSKDFKYLGHWCFGCERWHLGWINCEQA